MRCRESDQSTALCAGKHEVRGRVTTTEELGDAGVDELEVAAASLIGGGEGGAQLLGASACGDCS
jgi:hypothetical protein